MNFFKQYFLNCLFIISFAICTSADENEFIIGINYQKMDHDWSILPETPPAFQNSKSRELLLNYKYNNLHFKNKFQDFNLNLQRQSSPKDVSLNVTHKNHTVEYDLNKNNSIYIFINNVVAKNQIFQCYTFIDITIGACSESDLTISSSNIKYNNLDGIISISGDTTSYGIGASKKLNFFLIELLRMELHYDEYNYDWISPVEDINSDFILNLSINGLKVRDAIQSSLKKLPQRNTWNSTQLRIAAKQSLQVKSNVNLYAIHEYTYIQFKNYQNQNLLPSYNYKVSIGIDYKFKKLKLGFYGDYYKNNLLGFNPIVFNQRTESYFDEPYGEVGLSLLLYL
jgi:hypothetical protein